MAFDKPPLNQPHADKHTGLFTLPWSLWFSRLWESVGPSGPAPADAEYVLGAADASLPNGRLPVASTSVTWNLAMANQITAERAALTGDVTASANSNTTALSTTGVSAATYGSATEVGQFTVDAKGRITAASNVTITGNAISVATVTLTDAEIKALPTTTIAIGPAPGAGNRIRIIACSFHLNSTAGAYTNIDATYAEMGVAAGIGNVAYGPVDDAGADPAFAILTAFVGAAANQVYDVQVPILGSWNYGGAYGVSSGYAFTSSFMPEASVNSTQAFVYINNNGTGDLTGGNAANTLKVTLYYAVEAL